MSQVLYVFITALTITVTVLSLCGLLILSLLPLAFVFHAAP